MTPRRIVLLLSLSFACLAVGLLAGRARQSEASSEVVEEGPSAATAAVLSAFDADKVVLGAALYELFDELSSGERALLDRPPEYDWIDAYRIDPLQPEDLVALAETAAAPAVVFGTRDRHAQLSALSQSQGIFSAVTVGCAIEALVAEAHPDGEREEEFTFADQVLERAVVRRSRSLVLPFSDGTVRTHLQLTGQLAPASSSDLEVAQSWQLTVLLGLEPNRTVRLVATWLEASSESFNPANRLWAGWVVHGAFEEARGWTEACAGTTVTEASTTLGTPERTPSVLAGGSVPPAPEALASPGHAVRVRTAVPVGPAPLCSGVRLITIEGHARTLMETKLELDTIDRNFDALDAEIDAVSADILAEQERGAELARELRKEGVEDPLKSWREEGIRRWAEVVGTPRSALTAEETAMLGRLVDRFGDMPDQFHPENRVRIRARWRKGALQEFLLTDTVQVPVCPDDLSYAADKLGWRSVEQRNAHMDDIELVVASSLVEAGSIRAVTEREWEGLRTIFGFGESLMRLFETPDAEIDSIDVSL